MSKLQTNAIRHLGSAVDNMTFDSAGRVLMPNQPAFLVGINSNTDATIAAGSLFAFDTAAFNIGSCYNTSTKRFTAPVAGVYEFTASAFLTYSGGISGGMQFGITKNGSFVFVGSDSSGCANLYIGPNADQMLQGQISTTLLLSLAAGDYIEMRARGQCRVYQGHCYFQGRLTN